MKFIYNDGGKSVDGFDYTSYDCVSRAIAIATGKSYWEVWGQLHSLNLKYAQMHNDELARDIRKGNGTKSSSPDHCVSESIFKPYLQSLGWAWVQTKFGGKPFKAHLNKKELPAGRLIVIVAKHMTAVIDGVLYDTYDCSNGGTRCVYGYYQKTKNQKI